MIDYTSQDLERADHMLKRWDVLLLGPDVCLAQTIAMVRAEERRAFAERLYAIREEVACGDANGRLADLIEELGSQP